ncbi:MAG TPA: GNAT family N-acetyltransferase [Pseudolabrys sp.]|nr:GNAT family N-acetyltransferase [Pseudolabrys sp.]
MRSGPAQQLTPAFETRYGALADLAALQALENEVFAADRISRRSIRHFLTSSGAALIVVEQTGTLAGYALALFRPRSTAARLYSIAVAPRFAGLGLGSLLLDAAEAAACERNYRSIRLEVHVDNAAAIALYRKAGYRQFGHYVRYYDDGADALRLERPLYPPRAAA